MIRKVVCLCAINRVDNNPMQQEHISMSTGTHGWQFDRKVNVANLVLIAGLLLGGISWINGSRLIALISITSPMRRNETGNSIKTPAMKSRRSCNRLMTNWTGCYSPSSL